MWTDYERWNEALAEVIFPRSDEARPVYIDLEDDLVEELAKRLEVSPEATVDALCDAVAATLDRSGGPGAVFAGHDRRLRSWIGQGRSTQPPILALLATFSLAAEQMAGGDGMSSNNYFGRLRQVLRWQLRDPALDVAYRRVAERYWGELNGWLIQEQGTRGIPTAYSLAHRYVGLPVSQALVRSRDREKLKEFFQIFGFVPGSHVAPGDLIPLLDSWIKQAVSPVTASLVRLWANGQARARIAEAAAVTLASWDGSVSEGSSHRSDASGRLLLTLEIGGFPRARFSLSALLYVPEAGRAREALVTSASPPVAIDLVPDVPGALGLAPGASLYADDVLAGILRIRDSLSDSLLERRPRRLVAFREDDLSRRWVETQQVMLGDDLRLLVEDGLAARVSTVLATIARPGWQRVEPYPGQPAGWSLFTAVEVLNHPGDLIPGNKFDDLAALIPLTSSTLKVSGGFAIPGSVRGKWHTSLAPEVRAVSDAEGGFTVRLVHVDRDAETPADVMVDEWPDEGAGVVVASLRDLELYDGDYRVELVPTGSATPTSSAMIYLRSGDSRDERQWHLADSLSYGPGLGALGVPVTDGSFQVQGHEVTGQVGRATLLAAPATPALASVPSWPTSVGGRSAPRQPVRIAVPDEGSCIRTGRHRELIETVEVDAKGRPLKAWSYGRCQTCGLVKRYPTRLKSPWGRQAARAEAPTPAPRDLSSIAPTVAAESDRDWSLAIDTLMHLGGGAWGSLEKVALQVEPTGLFVDQFARMLEALGHISIARDPQTLRPVAWELSPTQLTGTDTRLACTGYWPPQLYNEVADGIDADETAVDLEGSEPSQYLLATTSPGPATQQALQRLHVAVLPRAWERLALALPPLSEVFAALPRQASSADGEVTWFDVKQASWQPVGSYEAPGAYRIRKFATLDVVRSAEDVAHQTYARSSVQLSKHIAALMAGTPLAAYDPSSREFMVPVGAELPGLYGRTLVAASCRAPQVRQGSVVYVDVAPELAAHMFALLAS